MKPISVNHAREITKQYHQDLYTNNKLFQKGTTWMVKREEQIIKIVTSYFLEKNNIRVLDLGSGVGRNAIPIAKIIGKRGGKVFCVDYLPVAINQLNQYARDYGVSEYIDGVVSAVEDFNIESQSYDLIIAHSVLTHTASKAKMIEVMQRMVKGTKSGGINYIYDITNLREFDFATGEKRDSDAEVDLSTVDFYKILKDIYSSWDVELLKKTPYEEKFPIDGREIIWQTDYVTFIARNN